MKNSTKAKLLLTTLLLGAPVAKAVEITTGARYTPGKPIAASIDVGEKYTLGNGSIKLSVEKTIGSPIALKAQPSFPLGRSWYLGGMSKVCLGDPNIEKISSVGLSGELAKTFGKGLTSISLGAGYSAKTNQIDPNWMVYGKMPIGDYKSGKGIEVEGRVMGVVLGWTKPQMPTFGLGVKYKVPLKLK